MLTVKVIIIVVDSQVFAEEVEPTGAVPMELSLERYRFAALPTKFKDNTATPDDKRLKPRVSLKFFSGSQILINVSPQKMKRGPIIYFKMYVNICIHTGPGSLLCLYCPTLHPIVSCLDDINLNRILMT